MTTILHLIQQLSLGGASRSLIATSKYSARQGAFRHRALSLAPADPAVLPLVREAGLELVDNPNREQLLSELSQADIVQVHWWNNAVLQTILHWDLPALRLMFWYHVAGNGVPQIITPELVRMADLNVATNPFTYHELPVFRYMPASDRAERLAMIYDPADFARLEGLVPRPHPHFNVGYIGTVDTFKMHPRYVAMSASIHIPDVRFVVCGGGQEEELRRQAQALGAENRFEFRGYVHDIRPVLETLDVYGYPLCENTYASGELNLQEAMAAGVPPVAFPNGGVKRLIVHEFTGLLVETEREYGQAIEHLYHHPEELGRLGRNAKEFASQMFGAENAARKLNPLYERLMRLPKRSRTWGGQSGVSSINQPVALASLNAPPEALSGAQLFVESLGTCAGEFGVSQTSTELAAALEADAKIGAASRLVQYGGVFAYRLGYPNDPWLIFWSALGSLHTGDAASAAQDFALAMREGFPHWRIYWHFAQAAYQAGQHQPALEALQHVVRQAPHFSQAKELLQQWNSGSKCDKSDLSDRSDRSDASDKSDTAPSLIAQAWSPQDLGSITLENASLEPTTNGPDSAPRPLVSILISTCEAEKFMRRCLEDIFAQTIASRCEIIVIDSGSTQNEKAIVEEFQRQHPNLRYLRTQREPLYAAWNRGIAMARGKYVTNANTDDAHRSDALERLTAALEAHPEADLAYGDVLDTAIPNARFEDPHPIRQVKYPPFHPAQALFFCPLGCHPLWRRSVFDQIGLFDDSYQGPGDYEFLLRFIQSGRQAVHVPETLSCFYKNPQGLSLKSSARARQEHERVLSRYRAEMPIDRLFKIDPANPVQVARGWTALGNLALCHEIPWFDNPQQDLGYAHECYLRALQADPGHETAIHNLVVLLALQGQVEACEAILKSLPPDLAASLRQSIQSGQLHPRAVELPPATSEGQTQASRVETSRPESDSWTAAPAGLAPAPGVPASTWPVRWVAPFLSSSEYGLEAGRFALALQERLALGTYDQSEAKSHWASCTLSNTQRAALGQTRFRFPFLTGGLAVIQQPGDKLVRVQSARYHVARTFAEADRIPLKWVTTCNQMDEVWVPSQFHVDAFASSGVERTKLKVMPGPVDERAFNPALVPPLELPNRARTNFLAEFEWSARAGWEVLLEAYWKEFAAGDEVCLYVRSWVPGKTESAGRAFIEERIEQWQKGLGLKAEALPRVVLLTEPLAWEDRPKLFKAADCFVAPSRGEGTARAQREAMMMGLPIIGTGWGGFAEHLSETTAWSLPFELRQPNRVELELRHCRAGQWAEPSLAALRLALRQAVQEPAQTKSKGLQARCYALEHFSGAAILPALVGRIEQLQLKLETPVCPALPSGSRQSPCEPDLAGEKSAPLHVAWEGPFLDLGSLAHVNRELTRSLEKVDSVQITCVGRNNLAGAATQMPSLQAVARKLQGQGSAKTQITVRHAWPPLWEAPAAGDWVLIQPWEYGVLPESWVTQLSRIQEIWVPSEFVRRTYLESGVDPSTVKVVPNGVDPERFRPGVTPLKLATTKTFKFLFVGGTIYRKGPDVLLQAYLETFTAKDDVCLVIKDFGSAHVYAGQTFAEQVRQAQQKPGAPEILYLDQELVPDEMPGLYAACDCLAHPYRGEGFGLPILEAMACGLPVIVTAGGASDDFATDDYAYRIPSRRRTFGTEVSGEPLMYAGWMLEPDVKELSTRMRWVVEHRDEARTKGRAASEYARREWSWDRAARIAAQRLHQLHDRRRSEADSTRTRRLRRAENIALPAAARVGHLNGAHELLRQGKLPEAWQATSQALAVRPYHPQAFLLLAEIARAAGDTSLAKRLAGKAGSLAPQWDLPKKFHKTNPGHRAPSQWRPPEPPVQLDSANPKLTVCLIAKNEEAFIGQCLESVRSIAHQIIVVDTGSTDWTASIAQRYGAEVYQIEWTEDFSAARNKALEHATGDWILMIDADEELAPSSLETLGKEMRTAQAMAWRVPIVDRGREEEGCSYVPRLFRNAPGLFYVGRIHEQVFSSLEVRRAEWGLENLLGQTQLIHHGYAPEVLRQRDKIARNLGLLERALEELPNEPNLLMNLGLELMRSGQTEEGLDQYWEAFHVLSLAPASERVPELVESLLSQLTTHLLARRDYASVVQLLRSPLASAQDLSASLHFAFGLALMEVRQFSEAIQQMHKCLAKRDRPTITPINLEIRKAGPWHCVALCHRMLKQLGEASKAFERAAKADPASRPVRFDYSLFLADHDQPIEALRLLHSLVGEEPGDLTAWLRGGQIALSRPDFASFAADWTGEAIKWFPRQTALLLQRAEALLLTQNVGEALPLWIALAQPAQARAQAAKIICQIVHDQPSTIEPSFEPAVSQEFIKWYRTLIGAGAEALVLAINQRLDLIRTVLPTAGQTLERVLTEVQGEAVEG